MTTNEIVVNVRGVDVNLAQLLDRLEARMRTTDAEGLKLGNTLGTRLAGPMQQTADGALWISGRLSAC